MKKILYLFSILFFLTAVFAQTNQTAQIKDFHATNSNTQLLYPPFSTNKPPVNNQPVKSVKDNTDFFEKNYRATWDRLSEFEQYAIAFSSNFFELHDQYHLDFSCLTVYKKDHDDPKKILATEWNIGSKEKLLEVFDWLLTEGHSAAFQKLSALLDKYPEMNVFDIAQKEELSISNISRLLYVEATRKSLGIHNIEAWDLGRAIAIMRWGIASGYINVEEVTKLCTPVVEKIRKDYVSWYDYISHFVQGRYYFGLDECTEELRQSTSYSADTEAFSYIPFASLIFTGENADPQKAYTGHVVISNNNTQRKEWRKVQELYKNEQTQETIKKLCDFEEGDYSEYPGIFLEWHLNLLEDYGTDQEILDYIYSKSDYIESLSVEGNLYHEVMYCYLRTLNNSFQPEKVIQVVLSLPDLVQRNTYVIYQYGFANYLMISFCDTQRELEYYTENAIRVFDILQQNDFTLDNIIAAWLERVR
ncbi:MAG: DUF1266 domain-containing protein [Treponema sp.]|nr:DUF1266 domain-containing protein [Treponema sp.]